MGRLKFTPPFKELTAVFLSAAQQVADHGYKYLVVFPHSNLFVVSNQVMRGIKGLDAKDIVDLSNISKDFVVCSTGTKIYNNNPWICVLQKDYVEFAGFKTAEEQEKLTKLLDDKGFNNEDKEYHKSLVWEGQAGLSAAQAQHQHERMLIFATRTIQFSNSPQRSAGDMFLRVDQFPEVSAADAVLTFHP